MDFWQRLLDRLDLDPVVAAGLACLVLSRLAFYRLRFRRSGPLNPIDAGLLIIGACYLVIRPFVLELAVLTTPAMMPTLQGDAMPRLDRPNDRLLVTKHLFGLRPPRRGEVVAYKPVAHPGDAVCYGRVLGLPGEMVELTADGVLLVDDQPHPEPYLDDLGTLRLPRHRVPRGCYFIVGDNREVDPGCDEWFAEPFVPEGRIRGKVTAVAWPPHRLRLID